MRILTALLCLALLAGGCGGDDDESPGSAASEDAAGERSPGETPAPGSTPDPDPAPAPGESEPDGGDQAPPQDDPPASPDEDPPDASEPAPRNPGSRAGGDARRVRATITRFLAALRAKDAAASCAAFTREVRNLAGSTLGGDCPRGMEFILQLIAPDARAFERVRIRSVRVDGDRALARLRLPQELRTLPLLALIAPRQRLTLERERGSWRLGLPLP